MLTVSLFGFITTLAEGLKTRLVYLVCDSLFTSAELFVVCDGANTVTREAGLTFQSKLLDIGQTSLNDQAQQEVDAFLRTIELRPPEINFGGYVVVNRGMLLSVSLCTA
ncbi:gustatory and odorant receptor 63a-like [Periplaneta americana]|uniref:gustatory and odorant receptor 63a-like n=1 Tax=Periplaneta americana TaxID=6978 RepID=UPI0037E8F18A